MPRQHLLRTASLAIAGIAAFATIGMVGTRAISQPQASNGPADQGPRMAQDLSGDAALGRDVFRFETFGNEGSWTDAVRLPAGIAAAKVTPMQALELGLQVDVDSVPSDVRQRLARELKDDPSGRSSSVLNDASLTPKLVMANAVMGMSAKGDKVGASCALCHSMSDASVFKSPKGGSIGHRIDGPANHNLNLGMIFAMAANTRALYAVSQLTLVANKGKTLGRAPTGLTPSSTEAEFDAYFSNPKYYPVGMFDDSFDGNGDPMHNTPLCRQDLAAPYGSEGTFTKIDDFSNLVFTSLFDQTMLTTPGGRAFVHNLAGPAGDEMIDGYVKVLAATGVTGYPYVKMTSTGKPGELATPVGVRVDNHKLLAMNAYLAGLQAPRGAAVDRQSAMRGKMVFQASGCASCHNTDQGRPVPTTLHPMKQVWPGDAPMMLAQRDPPLNPVLNSPGVFDDKWAVVNASVRGEKRGVAMPLLLDLARKPVFLHDNSVPSLEALFDPRRGPTVPHPFYVAKTAQRADVVNYLKSLDTGSR